MICIYVVDCPVVLVLLCTEPNCDSMREPGIVVYKSLPIYFHGSVNSVCVLTICRSETSNSTIATKGVILGCFQCISVLL